MNFLEDLFGPTWPAVWTLAKIVAIVVPLLLCVAYLTFAERKLIGKKDRVEQSRFGALREILIVTDVGQRQRRRQRMPP